MTPSREPVACLCGNCGESFSSKAARRRHRQAGCTPASNFIGKGQGDDTCPDEWQYGRVKGVITPAVKARADAEWEAMDERGRLPAGWVWPVRESADA